MATVRTTFGQFFSFAFNPLFMPLFGMVWILYYSQSADTELMHPLMKRYLLAITAVFSSLLPLFTLVLMKIFGLADKLELPRRRDRLLPIAISAMYAVFGFYFVTRIPNQNPFFYLLPLGSAVLLMVALVFTSRFQISIHMMGVGALSATFVLAAQFLEANFLYPVLVSILVAGFTGFARITLNAHKPYQVYAGYLAGFATQYLGILLLANFLY